MVYSKEEYRAYFNKKRLERKLWAKELLGGKCVSCSSDENLEFDHVSLGTKSFEVSEMWAWSKARLEAELAKCQLLCTDCHIQKTVSEGAQKINPPKGERNGSHKLTESQILEIRELSKTGLSQRKIAKIYKVSHVQIGRIANKKYWKHI